MHATTQQHETDHQTLNLETRPKAETETRTREPKLEPFRPWKFITNFVLNPRRAVEAPVIWKIKQVAFVQSLIAIPLSLAGSFLVFAKVGINPIAESVEGLPLRDLNSPDFNLPALILSSCVSTVIWTLILTFSIALLIKYFCEEVDRTKENPEPHTSLNYSYASAAYIVLPSLVGPAFAVASPLLSVVGYVSSLYLAYAVYGKKFREFMEK